MATTGAATPGEELALLGSLKDTPTILGRKFCWRTLNSDEEAAASAASSLFDERTRQRVLKLEKLARAIVTIDGVPFTPSKEEADRGVSALAKARDTIFKWQPPVVERVYAEFEKLEKMREQAVEDLEKNAKSPVTGSGSIK